MRDYSVIDQDDDDDNDVNRATSTEREVIKNNDGQRKIIESN